MEELIRNFIEITENYVTSTKTRSLMYNDIIVDVIVENDIDPDDFLGIDEIYDKVVSDMFKSEEYDEDDE